MPRDSMLRFDLASLPPIPRAPSPLAGEGRVGGASATLVNVGDDTPSSISSPQGRGEALSLEAML
jgi:hypothetical protein